MEKMEHLDPFEVIEKTDSVCHGRFITSFSPAFWGILDIFSNHLKKGLTFCWGVP